MINPVSTAIEGRAFRFRMEIARPDAVPADIARLSEVLTGFLGGQGVIDEDINALQIALEELLTNLGKFGVPGAAIHAEGVVEATDNDVSFTLADNGPAFDPTRQPSPDLNPDAILSRPVGGLGLHMMLQLFEDVAYRREDGRNVTIWRRRRSS